MSREALAELVRESIVEPADAPATTAEIKQEIQEEEPNERVADPVETVIEDEPLEPENVEDDEQAEEVDSEEADSEEADEQDEQETEEEPAEETVLITVDNKELRLPAGTPPEVVETFKRFEKDLYTDYQRKTAAVAEDKRQLQTEAAELKTQTLEAQRAELQKAQARAQTAINAATVPDNVLASLRFSQNPSDQQLFQQLSFANQQVHQNLQALDAEIAEVDKKLAAEREAAEANKAAQAEQKTAEQARVIQERAVETLQKLNAKGHKSDEIVSVINDVQSAYPGLPQSFWDEATTPEAWLLMRDAMKFRAIEKAAPDTKKRVSLAKKSAQKGQTRETPRNTNGQFRKDGPRTQADLTALIKRMRKE